MNLVDRITQSEDDGLLLLIDSSLSDERINQEWSLARRALKLRISARLSVVSWTRNQLTGWPRTPGPERIALIDGIVRSRGTDRGHRLPRRHAESVVLRTLIDRWFVGNEPITVLALGQQTGFSFPTLSTVLKKLGDIVVRESDRSVRLSRFPEKHWLTLIVNAEQIRSTLRFHDASRIPLGVDKQLSRLNWAATPRLAVGGALAAQRLFPAIDLVGIPRLDLCVHAPENEVDLSFVEQLNPALELTEGAVGPCDLAIHFVRSADPMFTVAPSKPAEPTLAGPSEILLDLHELGFSDQADSLRSFLEKGSDD